MAEFDDDITERIKNQKELAAATAAGFAEAQGQRKEHPDSYNLDFHRVKNPLDVSSLLAMALQGQMGQDSDWHQANRGAPEDMTPWDEMQYQRYIQGQGTQYRPGNYRVKPVVG